jgi:hypothetical protein
VRMEVKSENESEYDSEDEEAVYERLMEMN